MCNLFVIINSFQREHYSMFMNRGCESFANWIRQTTFNFTPDSIRDVKFLDLWPLFSRFSLIRWNNHSRFRSAHLAPWMRYTYIYICTYLMWERISGAERYWNNTWYRHLEEDSLYRITPPPAVGPRGLTDNPYGNEELLREKRKC